MKKLLLATFALMVLSACSNNPKPDGPLGTSRDFVLGVMSNNAGLQIPNVFAQSGEHYVLARFFGKDTSVLCSNLTGKDVCYDPKGSVIGESDTKLQLTFGRAIVGRALAKEQKLTEANGMHFDVPDIAGKEFTSSEMLPAVFQGIAFPKKSVRAQSCESAPRKPRKKSPAHPKPSCPIMRTYKNPAVNIYSYRKVCFSMVRV